MKNDVEYAKSQKFSPLRGACGPFGAFSAFGRVRLLCCEFSDPDAVADDHFELGGVAF